MSRLRRMLPIGALWSLALWGCASGPAPIDHFYRIDAGAPAAPAAKRLQGNLQVDRLSAEALAGERQLLSQQTAAGPEIRQHAYQRWSDPPAILLQTELVSFLNAAHAADRVISATARVKPDYVVSGRVHHFERVLEPSAHVVVEIQLTLSSASGEILINQNYREERSAANSDVAAAVDAFSEAIHDIFERFLTDLGTS